MVSIVGISGVVSSVNCAMDAAYKTGFVDERGAQNLGLAVATAKVNNVGSDLNQRSMDSSVAAQNSGKHQGGGRELV